jgi:hypothetical protein
LTQQTLFQNYLVSLRLVDGQGLELAQLDTQPGYGFRPSSGWPAGQWTNDWLTLPLPPDFAPSQPETGPYALVARLYDAETEEVALTRRLGELTWENGRLVFRETAPVFTLPGTINPAAATFGDLIQLRGYTMEQTAGLLNLTLYWQALANGREDFYHFVHLVDTDTGDIVAQHDSMPRNNGYPTGQWTNGEIISDPLSILVESLPPGEYLLYVGFYRNLRDTFPRLPAVDAEGRPLADNRFLLQTIFVE